MALPCCWMIVWIWMLGTLASEREAAADVPERAYPKSTLVAGAKGAGATAIGRGQGRGRDAGAIGGTSACHCEVGVPGGQLGVPGGGPLGVPGGGPCGAMWSGGGYEGGRGPSATAARRGSPPEEPLPLAAWAAGERRLRAARGSASCASPPSRQLARRFGMAGVTAGRPRRGSVGPLPPSLGLLGYWLGGMSDICHAQ